MSLNSIKINTNQVIGVDEQPSAGSNNLVKSGGVFENLGKGGLNGLDDTFEVGDIATGNGQPISGDRTLRSVNYNPILASEKYTIISRANLTSTQYLVVIFFYDINKNYVPGNTIVLYNGNEFTTPDYAAYYKIVFSSAFGLTYKKTCILTSFIIPHLNEFINAKKDEEKVTNYTVFTKKREINRIIKKLYFDISNYNGSYSLEGIYISILANNFSGVFGVQIKNASAQTLASFFISGSKPHDIMNLYDPDGSSIYMYAEFNWSMMSETRIQNIEITEECFNPIYDNRRYARSTPLTSKVYGAAGDSITAGAGIDESTLD